MIPFLVPSPHTDPGSPGTFSTGTLPRIFSASLIQDGGIIQLHRGLEKDIPPASDDVSTHLLMLSLHEDSLLKHLEIYNVIISP